MQIQPRSLKLWCFLFFMNEKFNKNAKVEKLTKKVERGVRLIVIGHLEIFIFLYIFQKMSSRRQVKLITIYRIPGFSVFISSRSQCNTCFQYAISRFAKAYRNNFASNFWQVAVCGIHMSKSFKGYHILLLELISFQKWQPQKLRQRQIVNYVMRTQRLHKLQYHRKFLVLFSMMYPLFNKIQRNFNETVCERTRFAKI